MPDPLGRLDPEALRRHRELEYLRAVGRQYGKRRRGLPPGMRRRLRGRIADRRRKLDEVER